MVYTNRILLQWYNMLDDRWPTNRISCVFHQRPFVSHITRYIIFWQVTAYYCTQDPQEAPKPNFSMSSSCTSDIPLDRSEVKICWDNNTTYNIIPQETFDVHYNDAMTNFDHILIDNYSIFYTVSWLFL